MIRQGPGHATVCWTQTTDPKATARIMLETLKAMARRWGEPRPMPTS